jgi:transcriptional regulator with XRE-family HTH domain
LSTSQLKKFGAKVRALRTGRGLTLKRLAAALDMGTHSYLSEVESGKKVPSVVLVLRLARYFGVSTDALLRDEVPLAEPEGAE